MKKLQIKNSQYALEHKSDFKKAWLDKALHLPGDIYGIIDEKLDLRNERLKLMTDQSPWAVERRRRLSYRIDELTDAETDYYRPILIGRFLSGFGKKVKKGIFSQLMYGVSSDIQKIRDYIDVLFLQGKTEKQIQTILESAAIDFYDGRKLSIDEKDRLRLQIVGEKVKLHEQGKI